MREGFPAADQQEVLHSTPDREVLGGRDRKAQENTGDNHQNRHQERHQLQRVDARQPPDQEQAVRTATAGKRREVLVGDDVAAQREEQIDGEVAGLEEKPDRVQFRHESEDHELEVVEHHPDGGDEANARELADLGAGSRRLIAHQLITCIARAASVTDADSEG